jgi:hypothetical protein
MRRIGKTCVRKILTISVMDGKVGGGVKKKIAIEQLKPGMS